MNPTLVFAPDTVIRFRGGKIVIHNTSSGMPAFESDNPMLVGWLCQFCAPRNVEQTMAALQPSDRPQVTAVLEYLTKGNMLVAPEEAHEKSQSERSSEAKNSLRFLSRSAYELACDLNALSPESIDALRIQTGIGVEQRLLALLAAVDGMRDEIARLRNQQASQQLHTLGVTQVTRDLKLHIGCGKAYLPDWINIDIDPAPLAVNVLRGLPFPNASVARVFVSHLLEHLFFPADVKPFLNELRRVLAPGGLVRIVVPDIEQCITAYVENNREFFASRRETWPWWPENPTRLEDFLAYSGAGPEPAYAFESHKYGYDFETLSRVLRDAGFQKIIRSSFMGSEHADLRVDEVSAVAKARYGDRYYSLFVEATA